MQSFLTRYATKIKGVVSGFDRVRFRGTLRWLANCSGMGSWLWHNRVLWKDFPRYAEGLTDRIKDRTRRLADESGRPIEYLPSSGIRKETYAREIAERDNITSGLVCVLSAVEPCMSFAVGRDRAAKKLELRYQNRKCLHYYFYLIDSRCGWLNVRLQTWLPFTVHVVLNGREWLACQLRRRGIDFERRGNCFTDIADLRTAQQLLDRQRRARWPALLNRLLARVHPTHRVLFGKERLRHYWSADETEWATDVLFRSPEDLAAVYPQLVRHAITRFGSGEVLRFLGKRPQVWRHHAAEIVSHLGTRTEGVRVKHAINGNSVKMYDKQQSVLRVETTINQTREMKVYRASEADPQGPKRWQNMRKGVADLHRRTAISQASNERYFESLAAVEADATLGETAAQVCQRTQWKGRSARAVNPLALEDAKLLAAVNRGAFTIQGFRNRDLRRLLFGENSSHAERRSQTAKVTRSIRLLRAHGLVHKVSTTHRYTVSPFGRQVITALLTARDTNIQTLSQLAA